MIVVADYSEYQGEVHPPAGQIVIVRAHNGWRPDQFGAVNRVDAHSAGCPAVGLYQYLPGSVDPAAAAGALLQTIGRLAGNEWLICDLEEGAGDQQLRWQTWRSTVMAATGRPPWLYSGLAFAAAHNLAPDWVAAYQTAEPAVPHKLWQNTSTYPWPWGKADASVYDGSLPEFLAAIGVTTTPVTPAPPIPSTVSDQPVITGGPMPSSIVRLPVGANGEGWCVLDGGVNSDPGSASLAPAVPFVKLVAATGWCDDPAHDQPDVPTPTVGVQNRGGWTFVKVTGAQPGPSTACAYVVWTA